MSRFNVGRALVLNNPPVRPATRQEGHAFEPRAEQRGGGDSTSVERMFSISPPTGRTRGRRVIKNKRSNRGWSIEEEQETQRRSSACSQYPPMLTQTRGGRGRGGDSTSVECVFSITPVPESWHVIS
jgi:hypothetical protein